jgi:hypothetical protein
VCKFLFFFHVNGNFLKLINYKSTTPWIIYDSLEFLFVSFL